VFSSAKKAKTIFHFSKRRLFCIVVVTQKCMLHFWAASSFPRCLVATLRRCVAVLRVAMDLGSSES